MCIIIIILIYCSNLKASSPWAVMLSQQDGYISKDKPSKLVFMCSNYDLCHHG